MSTPVAIVKAYKRKGRAIVTVKRQNRTPRRYCVSLRRYRALREWTPSNAMEQTSGAWLRSSMTVFLRKPNRRTT